MQPTSETRAKRLDGRHSTRPHTGAATPRPDCIDTHGRHGQRKPATPRRGANQMQAQNGASMSYQQGFTSGPLS